MVYFKKNHRLGQQNSQVTALKSNSLVVLCSNASKAADGIADSADPYQTAPSGAVCSGSSLFAQTYFSHYMKYL